MRPDGSLRPSKPPRGLIVATGEDRPRGQSLYARMLVIEIRQGDIVGQRLTACQADAAAGLYAEATSAFIAWLAPRLDEAQQEFHDLVADLRRRLRHAHPRTVDIHAQLIAAYSIFIRFLLDMQVIDDAAQLELQERIGAALQEVAEGQTQFSNSTDPCLRFAELLGSAIAAGEAHLASLEGTPPIEEGPNSCGWRERTIGAGDNQRDEWVPQGLRVGWIEAAEIYLDLAASYRAAQHMAADGNGIEVSAPTLARRLRDRAWLLSTDKARQVLTVRRTVEGRRRDVFHLSAELIGLSRDQKPDQPDHEAKNSDK